MAAPYQSYPPSLWAPPDPVDDGRGSASANDVFTDPAITAQDATNAAKLTGLGFIADPVTAWASGAGITVNGSYLFHWDGDSWEVGVAPAPEPPETEPEPEVTDGPDEAEQASESPTDPTEEATE